MCQSWYLDTNDVEKFSREISISLISLIEYIQLFFLYLHTFHKSSIDLVWRLTKFQYMMMTSVDVGFSYMLRTKELSILRFLALKKFLHFVQLTKHSYNPIIMLSKWCWISRLLNLIIEGSLTLSLFLHLTTMWDFYFFWWFWSFQLASARGWEINDVMTKPPTSIGFCLLHNIERWCQNGCAQWTEKSRSFKFK